MHVVLRHTLGSVGCGAARFSNPITIATARAKRNASAGLSSTPAAIIEYCGAIEASMPVPVKRWFARSLMQRAAKCVLALQSSEITASSAIRSLSARITI